MKSIFKLLPVVVGTAVVITACGKKEEPPVIPNSATNASVPAAAVTQAVTAVETKAPELSAAPVPSVATAAPTTPAQAPAQAVAQGILERAHALALEKKYPEALAALSELSNANLTAEQESLRTRIKTDIANATTAKAQTEASKAVNNLFNK